MHLLLLRRRSWFNGRPGVVVVVDVSVIADTRPRVSSLLGWTMSSSSSSTSTILRLNARVQRSRGAQPSRALRARVVRASNDAVARERVQDEELCDAFRNIANARVNVVVVPRAETREMLATTTLRARFAAADREFTASGIASGDVPHGRALAEALGVANATAAGGELGGLEYDAEMEKLLDDAASVVRSFHETVCGEAPRAGVRATLSLLRSTLCSRLHVDHTNARAMVTYFGAGTEICDPKTSSAIAAANARGGNIVSDAMKKLCEKYAPPKEVAECDIALLKGERWRYEDGSTSKGKAIVHRSPLVDADAGEWRLTLKLDVGNFDKCCDEEH